MRFLGKLLNNERGASAIEYALIASLISIAAIAGYQNLGSKVESGYANVDTALDGSI